MVALKGAAIAAFLRRPDHPLALVYGPDAGLVAERAAALLSTVEGREDPFAHVLIDGDVLASNPHRLAEEAWTVPLFGGRRAIRVSATARSVLPAVEPLLNTPPSDALVVIEGGDLKGTAPLRKAFERSRTAVAIPCYADEGRGLDQLIDEVAGAASLEVSREAREMLRQLIGADRLASRRELEKLVTYCHGKGRIEAEHVSEISGDASAFALDAFVDAVGVGDVAETDRSLRKSLASGTAAASIISALARHFLQLNHARQTIDRGETADAAMRSLRPPIFFKRENAFRRQINGWSVDALNRALDLIAQAELQTRTRPELAQEILGRCVMSLAGARNTRSAGASSRRAGG